MSSLNLRTILAATVSLVLFLKRKCIYCCSTNSVFFYLTFQTIKLATTLPQKCHIQVYKDHFFMQVDGGWLSSAANVQEAG